MPPADMGWTGSVQTRASDMRWPRTHPGCSNGAPQNLNSLLWGGGQRRIASTPLLKGHRCESAPTSGCLTPPRSHLSLPMMDCSGARGRTRVVEERTTTALKGRPLLTAKEARCWPRCLQSKHQRVSLRPRPPLAKYQGYFVILVPPASWNAPSEVPSETEGGSTTFHLQQALQRGAS